MTFLIASRRALLFLLPFSALLASQASQSVWADEAMHSTQVSLFGQPCLLQGPPSVAALKQIHAISPEQVSSTHGPRFSIADQKQLHTLQEHLQEATNLHTNLPGELDRYREKLAKRVDAQLAFFDTADQAIKTRKPQALIKLARQNCSKSAAKEFEKIVSQGGLTAQKLGALFEIYGAAIESEPEEEFHRAIRKMNVQYVCAFEEAPKPAPSDLN